MAISDVFEEKETTQTKNTNTALPLKRHIQRDFQIAFGFISIGLLILGGLIGYSVCNG
ncbi:hypothetical protein [Algicola sagamiensis]|uniref:hypothetical protein n=1 Tax=Algicola sagamiensis TaxID=163869 RepID=UPI00037D5335|nr:hypothetical protein [Algicola sagamiensis]